MDIYIYIYIHLYSYNPRVSCCNTSCTCGALYTGWAHAAVQTSFACFLLLLPSHLIIYAAHATYPVMG